jgi:hypothetical protein
MVQVRAGRDESSSMYMTFDTKYLDGATLHDHMTRFQDGIFGHAGARPARRMLDDPRFSLLMHF